MRLLTAVAAAGLAISAGAAQAASVSIKDAVARVTVIPEAREDIKVEILTTNPSLPLQVRQQGDRVIVDGDLDRKIRSCGGRTVTVSGVGEIAFADVPQIVIRTPMKVEMGAGGAVFGAIGRSDQLSFSHAGCGDWTIANVKTRLELKQAGSGDARVGATGEADISLAGSGDVKTQAVGGRLKVNLMGSGNVVAASVAGPVDVSIAGSGDVRVDGGSAASVSAQIAGSGDVDFRGSTRTLRARIAGSGDVRAREVTGEVSKQVMGSGSVIIG